MDDDVWAFIEKCKGLGAGDAIPMYAGTGGIGAVLLALIEATADLNDRLNALVEANPDLVTGT